jgi:outer membrane protein TolC
LPTILELVLAVLDAQRELKANEDLLAQSRTTQTVNLIALYRILGEGWQSVTLQQRSASKAASSESNSKDL